LSPFVGMTPATGTLRGCESEIYRWRRMAMGGNIGSATRVGPGADRIERSRRGAGAVERGGLEKREPSFRPAPSCTAKSGISRRKIGSDPPLIPSNSVLFRAVRWQFRWQGNCKPGSSADLLWARRPAGRGLRQAAGRVAYSVVTPSSLSCLFHASMRCSRTSTIRSTISCGRSVSSEARWIPRAWDCLRPTTISLASR